jgi:hypothetical protein
MRDVKARLAIIAMGWVVEDGVLFQLFLNMSVSPDTSSRKRFR